MFDLQKMMKQAQKMQERMQEVQAELDNTEVTGTAGGGAVVIVATANLAFKSVKIAPEAAGEPDMLEDLMLAAMKDLNEKAAALKEEKMKEITGGMNIPGMPKLPF